VGIPFSEALTLAETLILENGDYSAAIPILIAIAHEYELQDDHEWYSLIPKTLYLLGLAHELQGNQEQAVAAYWQLWYEYPTATYALMATAKLEEK
jgi:TolA-binding protein